MTDHSIKAIKARHWLKFPTRGECACGQPWICDAAILIEESIKVDKVAKDLTEALEQVYNSWRSKHDNVKWLLPERALAAQRFRFKKFTPRREGP